MRKIPPRQPVKGAPSPSFGQAEPPVDDDAVAPGGAYPAGEEPGALVSLHAAALHADAESFPVLKSFQDYLEAERRRARHRMALMAGLFVALMAVVVTGFIVVGALFFGYMTRQQEALAQQQARQSEAILAIALRDAGVAPAATVVPATTPPSAVTAPAPLVPGEDSVAVAMAVPDVPVAQPVPAAPASIAPATVSAVPAEPAPPAATAVPEAVASTPDATKPAPAVAPAPAIPAPAVAESSPAAPATPAPQPAPAAVVETPPAPPAPAAIVEAPTATPAKPRKKPLDLDRVVAEVEPPPDGYTERMITLPSPASDDPIPWRVYLPLR